MKNELIIKLDTESENQIVIGKSEASRPESPEEMKDMVLLDMATLCEALVVTIRVAGEMGVKPAHNSLVDCIKHLQDGFVDAHMSCLQGPGWKEDLKLE